MPQADQVIDQIIAEDTKKFSNPAYLPKLGGWPLERFTRLRANMSLVCKLCGHGTETVPAQRFGHAFGNWPAGTQLIKLKKMLQCPKCNGRAIYVQISAGRRRVDFGRTPAPPRIKKAYETTTEALSARRRAH